jgi:hypothetical protein
MPLNAVPIFCGAHGKDLRVVGKRQSSNGAQARLILLAIVESVSRPIRDDLLRKLPGIVPSESRPDRVVVCEKSGSRSDENGFRKFCKGTSEPMTLSTKKFVEKIVLGWT